MKTFALFSVLCTFLLLLGYVQASQGQADIDRRAGTSTNVHQPCMTNQTNKPDAATGDAATAAETAAETGTAADSTQTGADSDADSTQTGTKDSDTATKTDSSSSSTSIDPRMGAGGVSMLTPSTQGATSYYKIGENVTFGWKYTSLAVTPSAINVVASCSMNEGIYTISSNMSVEETGKAVWDTSQYQANATVPLLTATYTLYIYDAEKDMTDTSAKAGHLGSLNHLSFGMYVPKQYTPLDGECSYPSFCVRPESTQ